MTPITDKLAEALSRLLDSSMVAMTDESLCTAETVAAWNAGHDALAAYASQQAEPEAGKGVPQGPRTEFVLNELRSALNAMMTFFGMDEDENSKAVFDQARQAYKYAEVVMRPLEPWERQSLEDFRTCVQRWHEKAVAKGYDGVESMCDTALPYGTRDLRLVTLPAPEAQQAEPSDARVEAAAKALHDELGIVSTPWEELRAAQADAAREIARAVLQAADAVSAGAGWLPIETAPKDGRKMLLFYLNANGQARRVIGGWVTAEEAAETDEDGVGLEAGWYERIDNWNDYYQVAIHEGEPTHWMHLPAAPGSEPSRPSNTASQPGGHTSQSAFCGNKETM